MDMKDRVDNFLKVASERILGADESEVIWGLNDLYSDLGNILENSGDALLMTHLKSEWESLWKERNIRNWDEKFLKAIANEDPRSEQQMKLDELNRQLTHGRGKVRMGSSVQLDGTLATNSSWTTSQNNLEKELQELKDEIRANRYKTP